ncbi:MAG: conjugal transfer protein TraH [Alphaproteobacteria bacterium]|nr:conjugal transfer protein TraH [Alphaproteobacteria bacterium]
MFPKTISTLFFFFLCCFPSPIEASALDTFFQSLGGQVNRTTPGAFQDQAAGYYTGGGYVLRQNNSVVQPINISLPQLGAGCNNLDLYFGSFSFLQGEQLSQLLRQIGTGVPTYGLQLAMKTMAPQVENLLSQLRKSVQDMNNMMLNSCQASQKIVGGLWPKGTAASEQICMNERRSGGEDWFGARQHCGKPNAIHSNVQNAQVKYKDLMLGEYNLVWHVLKKMPEYAENKELASFIMSVTGTLISRREGETIRLKVIEPKADQKDFIAAYLKGGTTSQLTCDEDQKCLAPRLTQITIQDNSDHPNMTMKAKVIHKISELRVKYISKESIAAEDIAFLNDAVNVPVYRYIQVSVAAGTPFLMQDAAEYIAANVILTQFDRVMSEVLEAVDALQKIQLEDTAIESFKKNLQRSRSRVQSLLIGANGGSITILNQTIQAIEQAIVAKNS